MNHYKEQGHIPGLERTSDPAFRLGPVCRGQFGEVLSFLWPTVHTIIECPRFPGTITVEWFLLCERGCALGHRATTIHACAHLMKQLRDINYEPKVALFVPGRNKFGGITGEKSPASVHTMGLPGKVPLAGGKSPANGTWCERRERNIYAPVHLCPYHPLTHPCWLGACWQKVHSPVRVC